MEIVVEPHNPAWVREFNRIKQNLQIIFKGVPILSIEHVGSTSIPGLLAKPILDIDIIVTSQNLPCVTAALIKAGYTSLGNRGVPSRFAFRQPKFQKIYHEAGSSEIQGEMIRNTYVVIDGCIALRNHLDLKRMLLEDKELKDEYAEVKRGLVNGGVKSMGEYCRGKNKVVLKILERAGWNQEDLKEVRRSNSWWWAAWRMGVCFVTSRMGQFFDVLRRVG